MTKDTQAFIDWLDGKMAGADSSGSIETRRQFANRLGIDLGDLQWAFICGRNSMRKEVAGEDQVCNS